MIYNIDTDRQLSKLKQLEKKVYKVELVYEILKLIVNRL